MDASERNARTAMRNARNARKMSQADLAAQIGISQQALAKIESGATARPSRAILKRIADILEIPIEVLLLGDVVADLDISEAGANIARAYDRADTETKNRIMQILINSHLSASDCRPEESAASSA